MAVLIYMLHEPLTARAIRSSVGFQYVIVFVMLRQQRNNTQELQTFSWAILQCFSMIIKTRIGIEARG